MTGINLIKEGDTIVFEVNGEKHSIVTVRGKSKVKLGKAYCPVEPLIGCPFGSLFTLSADGKSLQRTEHVPSTEWDEPAEVTRDNSRLVDANANQQLTQEDLAAMREAGAAGEQIISALTNNSATFHTKTEFAQEKYKKRKAKKYVMLAVARRPTAATIASAYFSKQPSRVGYMRSDTLALMLGMANVGAGARVLVMETCGGLVTAAVAERLGGYGIVCSTHATAKPPRLMEIARTFNFDERTADAVRTVPLLQLLAQRQQQRAEEQAAGAQGSGAAVAVQNTGAPPDQSERSESEVRTEAVAAHAEEAEAATARGGEPMEHDGTDDGQKALGGNSVLPEAGAAAPPASVPAAAPARPSASVTHGPLYSGLILASPDVDPASAMRRLLPLLAPSASFAVFSPSVQPLAECMTALRTGGLAVNLVLQEAWYREHQVLPMRTHPTMAMNHGGGYLLAGTATLLGTLPPSQDGVSSRE